MERVLLLIYTVAFAVGVAYGAHVPWVPVFAVQELGASYFDIGMIGMANYVPYMFAPALVGLLLDRFNKGSILSAGIAMGMSSIFLLAFANTVLEVMLVRALMGIAHAFFWPSAEALVTTATTPEKRVKAISRYAMAWVGGYMAGPLLGALLFQSFGFRPLFEYSAAIMMGALVAALMLIRHGGGVRHELYSITDIFRMVKTNPRISTLVMYYSASFGIVLTILPAYLKESTIDEFLIGILFFILGLSRLSTLPFAHRFASRERASIFLATQAIAFAMLIAYSMTTFAFFSLALVLFGFAFSLYFPITLGLITKNIPRRMVGASVGAYEMVFGIGWATGPILSGMVADVLSSGIPYISMFVIGVVLPVLILSRAKQGRQMD